MINLQNIRKIIGKTIIIRKAEPTDLEAIYRNVWSDNDVLSTTYLYHSPDIGEARSRLERTINFQKDKNMFFLALKETNEAFGLCGIFQLSDDLYEEAGLILGKQFQHKGYGTEMLNILLDVVFNHLGAKEFKYSYCEGNDKSRGLADKFGFKFVGSAIETRGWDKKEFLINEMRLKKEDYKGIDFNYELQ